MHRRTAATRLVMLTTLTALAASLVGTVTVQARESRSTDRQLRINGDPERETAGVRSFRTVDVANLPVAVRQRTLFSDPVLRAARGHGLAGDSCAPRRRPGASAAGVE